MDGQTDRIIIAIVCVEQHSLKENAHVQKRVGKSAGNQLTPASQEKNWTHVITD